VLGLVYVVSGDPRVALGGVGEGVEPADAVTGGEVGADGAEGLRSLHGSYAAGYRHYLSRFW